MPNAKMKTIKMITEAYIEETTKERLLILEKERYSNGLIEVFRFIKGAVKTDQPFIFIFAK